jgi:hypothetical protein
VDEAGVDWDRHGVKDGELGRGLLKYQGFIEYMYRCVILGLLFGDT